MRPVNVYEISLLFLLLILFTATQDIAVDGWAITILSKQNTSYSATCQNVGINIGFFGSFTILLALNSPEFCEHYLWFLNDYFGRGVGESIGILEIGDFIVFAAYLYFLFTIWLFLFVNEEVLFYLHFLFYFIFIFILFSFSLLFLYFIYYFYLFNYLFYYFLYLLFLLLFLFIYFLCYFYFL